LNAVSNILQRQKKNFATRRANNILRFFVIAITVIELAKLSPTIQIYHSKT